MCLSYLISFNITEYYMSDRMLRQFGKVQGILVMLPKWDRRDKRQVRTRGGEVESEREEDDDSESEEDDDGGEDDIQSHDDGESNDENERRTKKKADHFQTPTL
ncbi:uncharacterized protein LOC110008142 [Amborella trichopoda]|uniref:uncharacterized protein LOC110008142 n=1 Tax=Amborella trichopoda TaxID=13333 RepID=UPI0009BDD6A7|nr:uncharacterized protein LOC110008142 [Amborella trichopoda]|eukprot:XP_020529439.1 uncharacterized protein LOC110008142 [Amborella trichopoda]